MQQVNLPKVTTTDDPINGIGSIAISNQPRPVQQTDNSTGTTPTPTQQMALQQSQSQAQPQAPTAGDETDNDSTWNDPWASAWDDPWAAGNKDKDKSKRLSPQERTEVIQKLYKEVLGREADTRDINYYKYSTLDEEEMRTQLLTGKEHKQLIDDGREYKQMKNRAEQSETRAKMLEAQVRDQVAEFKQVNELLQEKNRYINQLRNESHNPYNFTNKAGFEKQLSYTHYSQPAQNMAEVSTPKSVETVNEVAPHTQPMIHHEPIPTPSTHTQTPQTDSNASFSAPQFSKTEGNDSRVSQRGERNALDLFLERMGKTIRNILNI